MQVLDLLNRKLNKIGTNSVIPWNPKLGSREDMRMITDKEAKTLIENQKKEAQLRRARAIEKQMNEAHIRNINTVQEESEYLQEEKEELKDYVLKLQDQPKNTIKLNQGQDNIKSIKSMNDTEVTNELKDMFDFTAPEDINHMEKKGILSSFRKTGLPPEKFRNNI